MIENTAKSTAAPLVPFSDGNHWRLGWGSGLYNYDEQFFVFWNSFGPIRREPKSLPEEMAIAARLIADKTKGRMFVAMSGGLDSELVARQMLQEKVPFTPIIARFANGYNRDDISYAFAFCEKHGLQPHVVDLDIVQFFRDSVNTPYRLGNCAHLMQMELMRVAKRMGGEAVIAVGEQRYFNRLGDIVVPVPPERVAVTHFMQAEQVPGVSAFYCYTPELMLALLREAKAIGFDKIERLAHNIKEATYRKYWPEMTPRPKYSGFEEVAKERHAAQAKLKAKNERYLFNFSIEVGALERQLCGIK